MLHDFFVCHASEDHDEAMRLAESLGGPPTVFVDRCQVPALTDDWKDEVYTALKATRVFIALVGTGHHEKPYYQFELSTALSRYRQTKSPILVPVWIGPAGVFKPPARETIDALSLGQGTVVDVLKSVIAELNLIGGVAVSVRSVLDLSAARAHLENLIAHGGPAADAAAMLSCLIEEDRLLPSRAFTARSTYPLARLAHQLPPENLVRPLERLLTGINDHERILHGAHLFGLLYSGPSQREAALSQFRWIHSHLARRSGDIAAWPAIQRQFLYTEAQLGDERARVEFRRALDTPDGTAFDIAYNFRYYGGDPELIRQRFERQLPQDTRPSDAFVADVLQRIYQRLTEAIKCGSSLLNDLQLDGWPTR